MGSAGKYRYNRRFFEIAGEGLSRLLSLREATRVEVGDHLLKTLDPRLRSLGTASQYVSKVTLGFSPTDSTGPTTRSTTMVAHMLHYFDVPEESPLIRDLKKEYPLFRYPPEIKQV